MSGKGFALLIGKGKADEEEGAEDEGEEANPMGGDEKAAMAVKSFAKALGVSVKDEAKAVQTFRAAVAACSSYEDDETDD